MATRPVAAAGCAGRRDVFRPPETRAELVDQFGSELVSTVLIPGSGHALIPEAPHEVAAALVEWIRTLA